MVQGRKDMFRDPLNMAGRITASPSLRSGLIYLASNGPTVDHRPTVDSTTGNMITPTANTSHYSIQTDPRKYYLNQSPEILFLTIERRY